MTIENKLKVFEKILEKFLMYIVFFTWKNFQKNFAFVVFEFYFQERIWYLYLNTSFKVFDPCLLKMQNDLIDQPIEDWIDAVI